MFFSLVSRNIFKILNFLRSHTISFSKFDVLLVLSMCKIGLNLSLRLFRCLYNKQRPEIREQFHANNKNVLCYIVCTVVILIFRHFFYITLLFQYRQYLATRANRNHALMMAEEDRENERIVIWCAFSTRFQRTSWYYEAVYVAVICWLIWGCASLRYINW